MRWLPAIVIIVAAECLSLHAQQPAGSIDVPAGATVILTAKGKGVQIYSCKAAPDGATWTLQGPDAKLLDNRGKKIGTHFAGPTWKLEDGSQVVGQLVARQPSPDPAHAVDWLLLRAKPGSGTGRLAQVAFISRTKTVGGVPAPKKCKTPRNVGKSIRARYSAIYTFYTDHQ